MDDTRLGRVVGCLHLREVDDAATHGGSSNKATICEVVQGLSVEISSGLLLLFPIGSRCLGTVESSVQVNAHNLGVVRKRAINHGTLSPRDTSVGNEDIQSAIEILHTLVDSLLNGLSVGDVTLVRLGCYYC